MDATGAMNEWDGESAYYTFSGNQCVSGQVCGHYTQIIWATTERLGCGFASCTSFSGFSGSGDVWVCQYQVGLSFLFFNFFFFFFFF